VGEVVLVQELGATSGQAVQIEWLILLNYCTAVSKLRLLTRRQSLVCLLQWHRGVQ
jgi:hypothetical protein